MSNLKDLCLICYAKEAFLHTHIQKISILPFVSFASFDSSVLEISKHITGDNALHHMWQKIPQGRKATVGFEEHV